MNKIQTKLLKILSLEEGHPDLLLTDDEWLALFGLADGHYIAPFLYTCLKRVGVRVPVDILNRLKTCYLQNMGRNLAISSALEQLAHQLEAQQIPMIPLKGVHLAINVYPTLGERIIGDLDLLVPKAQLQDAFDIATQAGYEATKPLIFDEWVKSKHQLCPQFNPKNQLTLEWHWHIFPPTQPHRLDIDALWERVVPLQLSNQPLIALSHEDTILHLANHISYHHHFLFGLRNLVDLMLFCQKYETQIDWQLVGERARRWQIEKGVLVVLRLVEKYLNVPIPQSFFEQFTPADLLEMSVDYAIEQLFVLPSEAQNISMTRQKVQSSTGLVNQMRVMLSELFPTPNRMATRYGIAPDSMSRAEMTLFRWRSLAQQAIARVKQKGDVEETAVSQILKRRQKLAQWLSPKG